MIDIHENGKFDPPDNILMQLLRVAVLQSLSEDRSAAKPAHLYTKTSLTKQC